MPSPASKIAVLTLAALFATPAQQPPLYQNPSAPMEKRVDDLLSRMTLEEKATMLSGSGWMESAPIERLGIPAIKMADEDPLSIGPYRQGGHR